MESPEKLNNAIYPQALQPGDTLAILSPAGPSSKEQFEQGMAYLESQGFRPRLMPNAQKRQGYLAGSDADRLSDLHAAFADPDIHGILAARGGYGCMRLLPSIDWDLIRANPKILIGFSDLTSLLLPIYQRTRLIGFHGPMLTSNLIEGDAYTRHELWHQVTGEAVYPYAIPNRSVYTCLKPGVCEGPLIGGNLSLLAALCGTPYQPDTRGAILFIEDWHEKYYSLDRQMAQLRMAGLFDGIAGLLLCDFTEIEEEETQDKSLVALFTELTAFLPVPTGYGFSLGHGDQTATFPMGVPARFEASTGRLEILSSPVGPGDPESE